MKHTIFLILAVCLLLTVGFRLRSHNQVDSTLKLFIDREESSATCMRVYLLTQLSNEPTPKATCYVLELPPGGNAPYVSAIPAGTYTVSVRKGGTLGWRLALANVPGRDSVRIHIGNFPRNTEGCLLPGKQAGANKCSVLQSAQAMAELQVLFAAFGESGSTKLTIQDIGNNHARLLQLSKAIQPVKAASKQIQVRPK